MLLLVINTFPTFFYASSSSSSFLNDPISGARLSNNTNCYNTKMIDKHSGVCIK